MTRRYPPVCAGTVPKPCRFSRSPRALRPPEPRDEHVLEVLPGPAPRTPVHVPPVPPLEHEPRALEDRRVELAAVVHDDADGRAAAQRPARVLQHGDDPVRISGQGGAVRPARGGADLELAPVVEPEQLVGVAMLLVV